MLIILVMWTVCGQIGLEIWMNCYHIKLRAYIRSNIGIQPLKRSTILCIVEVQNQDIQCDTFTILIPKFCYTKFICG